jgi:hypothetical protein
MPQDSLMRLVQQIGQMLARVLALRERGLDVQAVQEIDAMCLQTIGLPLEKLRRMSPEGVALHLEAGGALRFHRAITLAELLLQDAELSELSARPADALVSRLHAFCLLADSIAFLPAAEQASYRKKLDALATELSKLAGAHPYVGAKLRAYVGDELPAAKSVSGPG